MASIFWVEDQYHWIDKFKPILESADFADDAGKNSVVVHKFAESAGQAINKSTSPPDIVILDANMNGNDDAGYSLSRLLAKKWPQIPIIFLSEHSGTGIEKKIFEQTETRDFIAKHQNNIEQVLCWRIKALLRHKLIKNTDADVVSQDIIQCGELTIDLTTWNVYWHGERLMNPANAQRPLAPMPRKILRALVESSPHPVTTLQMSEKLAIDKFNYANYRQHIKILRQSFEQAAQRCGKPDFIESCKRGHGIVTFGEAGAYCWKP